ncbi:MAG: ABC transporter ATP-binding protein [Bacillota bacterium]
MLLNIENLTKSFDNKKILKDISFTLKEGEVNCFLGPSGCGKSTLLRILAGLEEADIGKIGIKAEQSSFIFQDHRLLPWLTTSENVELVLKNKIHNKDKRKKIVKETLADVNLEEYSDYYPDKLSGGMKQRVAIARALAVKPQLILMDEPFSKLDFPLRVNLINLLNHIFKNEDMSGIFVTHDTREAVLMGDKVMVMSENPGEIENVINIDIPKKDRSLGNPETFEIHQKLNDSIFYHQGKNFTPRCCRKMNRVGKNKLKLEEDIINV